MTANAERPSVTINQEPKSFRNILSKVPEAVGFAQIESESSEIATTPEGKFSLTYLLAARNLLRPVLREVTAIHPDLLQATGGPSYNPERSIDEVGTAIALTLARQTNDIPKFWMRTEESANWERMSAGDESIKEGQNFAVIDPLDMTSSIIKGDQVQTTGIAIYDRQGNLKTVGMVSLVDDGFIFMEKINGAFHVYPKPTDEHDTHEKNANIPLRVAAKTRRMHTLKDSPVMKDSVWAMDCDSGYAVLGIHQGKIDTIIDHVKGNPWYEVVIWPAAAQELGYPVTDATGKPLDYSAIMRRMIEKHEGDTYRIPFVISKTPEIHKTVLEKLQPPPPNASK